MEVLLGGLAGSLSGMLASLPTALVLFLGKKLRDRRRARRGEAAIQDRAFDPYWLLFGMLGLIAGASWTWRLGGTWVTGALAGLGVPAVVTTIVLVWALAQTRR